MAATVVHKVRIREGETLEVEWIRLKQIPERTPPEWEQETLVERYTSPPQTVWAARTTVVDAEKVERGS